MLPVLLGVLTDPCTDTIDCSTAVPNSICDIDSTLTCICDPNYLSTDTECLQRNLGDSCETDAQCVFGISVDAICDNTTSLCQCDIGYISRGSSPDEVCESRIITDSCDVNIDCIRNIPFSECSSSDSCECLIGYDPNADNSQCVAKILGDYCTDDNECLATITLSTCESVTCVCQPGHIDLNPNTCKLRQIHTDACTSTAADCVPAITNSFCDSNLCECESGYMANVALTTCTLRVIGDACVTDVDCSDAVTNSQCTDSACSCLLGYMETDSGSTCRLRTFC